MSEYVLALVVASDKRIKYFETRRLYSAVRDKEIEDVSSHGQSNLVLVSQRNYSAYAGGASAGSSFVGMGWAGGFLSSTPPDPEADGLRSPPSMRPPSE
jgi:hypothetical protein